MTREKGRVVDGIVRGLGYVLAKGRRVVQSECSWAGLAQRRED
jgi:hypothetical protein